MGWRTNTNVKIEERAVYRWRYQYATVDEEFAAQFPLGVPSWNNPTVDGNVQIGDEVVRRIRVNIVDERYPGLTKATAAGLLNTLRDDGQYGQATTEWNGAGGYDVVAQKVLVDANGWSMWIKIEDLETWGIVTP